MKSNNVVILATEGLTTNLLYNELLLHFDHVHVIIENKISKRQILRNRAKKIGWLKVIGQICFVLTVPKLLSILSKKRVNEILINYNLNRNLIPHEVKIFVDSINNFEVLEILKRVKPELIFVNGTRILSQQILLGTQVDLLNIHAGITPKYRGVHGGYWALYNNNSKLFGVTFHKVDKGIDTGSVIGQKVILPEKKDNFVTYPILQFAEGVNLLRTYLLESEKKNEGIKQPITNESNLYYHPTLLQYLANRLVKGVK